MKFARSVVVSLMALAIAVALVRFWGNWLTLLLVLLGQLYLVFVGIAPFLHRATMSTLPSYVHLPYLPGEKGNAIGRVTLLCFYLFLYILLLVA